VSTLRHRLGGVVGRGVVGALLATVRFEERRRDRFDGFWERGEPVLYACWHGRLLPMGYLHRHKGIGALISQSSDGEYVARVMEGWGFEAIRGSTSRGGKAAMREIVRRVGIGQSVAITPDGPRGPRQKAQPGVILAAKRAGVAILPVAAGCDRAWWPGGWDRFCIPKPFSRVTVVYGEPLRVPLDADDEAVERLALRLEEAMNDLIDQVDHDGGPDR
jgi:lysophospholipid acyltransferase (LPLAT)-like uncharacterized protein